MCYFNEIDAQKLQAWNDGTITRRYQWLDMLRAVQNFEISNLLKSPK
jgi:hypothetical protein